MGRTTAEEPALYDRQLCFVTTSAQVDALAQIQREYGIKSRAHVARDAIDAGLEALRQRYAASTLTRRRLPRKARS